MKNRRGFTLIELLVVIGIIAILFAIVLIAVNPSRQFKQSRDATRKNDVRAVLNAVWQYGIDHNGIVDGLADVSEGTYIPSCDDGYIDVADLQTDQLASLYIASIPSDPQTGDSYQVCQKDNGRIKVKATPELASSIEVER